MGPSKTRLEPQGFEHGTKGQNTCRVAEEEIPKLLPTSTLKKGLFNQLICRPERLPDGVVRIVLFWTSLLN
jgi:hypothetical protein